MTVNMAADDEAQAESGVQSGVLPFSSDATSGYLPDGATISANASTIPAGGSTVVVELVYPSSASLRTAISDQLKNMFPTMGSSAFSGSDVIATITSSGKISMSE